MDDNLKSSPSIYVLDCCRDEEPVYLKDIPPLIRKLVGFWNEHNKPCEADHNETEDEWGAFKYCPYCRVKLADRKTRERLWSEEHRKRLLNDR